MNVCVIGAGYVGLVTGVVFSHLGYKVVCVDREEARIEGLKRFEMPIFEEGLEDLVRSNVTAGRLHFTTDLPGAVAASEVVFVCVGTPPGPDGEPDLQYVDAVARSIAGGMNGYKIVVNKSTVPVGTAVRVRSVIESSLKSPVAFDVVSNPEFLREGTAVYDTLNPDRVVIGSDSETAAKRVAKLYEPLDAEIVITDTASAELIKYASNSFLALKISFMNQVATMCELTGANVDSVRDGVGLDKRIGGRFLYPGLGFGGSCFPKDCKGLYHTARKVGFDFHLMSSVLRVNEEQPARFVGRLRDELGGFDGKRIAVWGLAFKPGTDDIRDAKSIEVIRTLLSEGATVAAYDPIAAENAAKEEPGAEYVGSALQAASGAEALIIATEWEDFASVDLGELRAALKSPLIYDGRNLLSPSDMKAAGFRYRSVGRQNVG